MMIKRFSNKTLLSLPAALVLLVITLFPGAQRVWRQADAGDPVLQRRQSMLTFYQRLHRINTDLETFANLASYAADQTDDEAEAFLDDMTWLIIGSETSAQGIIVAPLGRIWDELHDRLGLDGGYEEYSRFRSSGFQITDKGNQVQHFWFSVIVSYHLGASFADALAVYHEWNAPGVLDLLPFSGHGRGYAGDLYLSRQAIWLGQALRDGSLTPYQVEDWLRENLS